jgi:RNA polymerase sigma factor (sigma-70 family)
MAVTRLSPLLRHIRQIRGRTSTGVSDAELLDRFANQQDEAAFELLVCRHERMVFGLCRRLLPRVQDAEDAFQAAFLVLARKASSISKQEAVCAWLYRVAYRIALRARGQAVRRARFERPMASEFPEPMSFDSQVDADDSCRLLDEEVNRLPEKYRTPIVLCYLEGHTNEEAARLLGCPTGTVVTRLARARKRLHARLSRRGVAISSGVLAAAFSNCSSSGAAPVALREFVVRTVPAFAAHAALSPLIVSAKVAALTRGALQAMLLTKIKFVAVVILVLGLIGAGSGALAFRNPTPNLAKTVEHGNLPLPNLQDQPSESRDEPSSPQAQANVKPKRDGDGHATTEEIVHKNFKTGGAPRIVVELYNGAIVVNANAEGTVDAKVTKRARAESDEAAKALLKEIDVALTQDGDTIHVTARQPEPEKHRHASTGAAAVIQVPARATLELHTSNGAVTLNGGSGKVQVKTANGAVETKDSKGSLNLHTSNGPITIHSGTGHMDLHTSNGSIHITAERAVVKAQTSNGGVRFDGSLLEGEHTLGTHNGGIAVTLPANAHFKVDGETSLGQVRVDFGTTHVHGKHLQVTIGENPTTTLHLHTSIGGITVQPAKAE